MPSHCGQKPNTPDSEDHGERPSTANDDRKHVDLGALPEGLELPESCNQDMTRTATDDHIDHMDLDTHLRIPDSISLSDSVDLFFDPKPPSQPYTIPFTFQTSLFKRPLWSTTAPFTTCKCCPLVTFTSEILSKCSTLTLQNTAHQTARDADIPIRAILHGWNAVTRKYSLDPLWSNLRHADEVIMSKCAPMERLVVLRNLCLMLRVCHPLPLRVHSSFEDICLDLERESAHKTRRRV
jgi:hypothetical protein